MGFFAGIVLYCAQILLFGLEYQKSRLISVLTLQKNVSRVQLQLESALSIFCAGFIGKTVEGMINGGESSYFFSYIASHFGFGMMLILVVLYTVQIVLVLQKVKKYEQPFAVIYPFIGMYTFRLIYSLGMNLGILPSTSIILPFLCSEPGAFLFDCVCVGFLRKYYLSKHWVPLEKCNIN